MVEDKRRTQTASDLPSVAASIPVAEAHASEAHAREATARASREDLALHARLIAGDSTAFAFLLKQYHGRLVRFARTFVSSDAVAEEVAQETWMAVMNGLASFEGRSGLKTWIFKILSNRAKTRAVREGRSVPFSALGDPTAQGEPSVDPSRFSSGGGWVDPPARWEENTPEKLLMRRELAEAIRAAIADLPDGQRAVATLRDLEGFESDEVCSILEIGETNQRVLLHRARAKLRTALESHFREPR